MSHHDNPVCIMDEPGKDWMRSRRIRRRHTRLPPINTPSVFIVALLLVSLSPIVAFLPTSTTIPCRSTTLLHSTIPQHVAFICDGNSRWAKARSLPTAVGHAAGADRLMAVLDALRDAGVNYATMYGFSTENWKRPQKEVDEILTIIERTARQMFDKALRERVRIRILGDLEDERLPESLREVLYQLERETSRLDTETTLCLAINYGGRTDILRAAARLAVSGDEITEESFSRMLSTDGIPDPDLIVRTSGESRLSNFLLWNAAYSELYFTDTLWPDFDETCLDEALDWYARRKRRFGAREVVGR